MFVPLHKERITLSIQTVTQAILQIRPFATLFEGCSLFCLMAEQRATNEWQRWDLFGKPAGTYIQRTWDQAARK